jgi:hypothetical protein
VTVIQACTGNTHAYHSLHKACLQFGLSACALSTVSAAKGTPTNASTRQGTHWRLTEEAVSCVPHSKIWEDVARHQATCMTMIALLCHWSHADREFQFPTSCEHLIPNLRQVHTVIDKQPTLTSMPSSSGS